jgi:Rps23 Pro-64 3,4-dihydroxylase Tpa1-like proline 4-hydroxylase
MYEDGHRLFKVKVVDIAVDGSRCSVVGWAGVPFAGEPS